jgi:hypothetical protein
VAVLYAVSPKRPRKLRREEGDFRGIASRSLPYKRMYLDTSIHTSSLWMFSCIMRQNNFEIIYTSSPNVDVKLAFG